MSVLQVAGEDIDFGGTGINVQTTAGYFRSGLARCAINGGGTIKKGNTLSGGAITSCWLSFYQEGNNSGVSPIRFVGLVLSSTVASGLWVANDTSDNTRVSVYKYDGTTMTRLIQGSVTGYYPNNSIQLHRIDLQLINYGASSTINLYVDGTLNGTFTGDCTVSGVTNLDCIGLGAGGWNSSYSSEIMACDEDSRSFSMLTMAPTGVGNTDSWTGVYTGVNGTSYSDSNPVYTNTATQDEDFNITDAPSTTAYSVKAVIRNVRAAKTAGSTATQVGFGFYIGSTHYPGTAQSMTTSFTLYQQFYANDPSTSAAWVYSSLNALQSNLRSS